MGFRALGLFSCIPGLYPCPLVAICRKLTSLFDVYLKIAEDGLVRDGALHLSGGSGREAGRFLC